MVLIMSVNPGFGGQSYIPYCTDKEFADCENSQIENIRDFRFRWTAGVNRQTLDEVLEAGADDIVAGSAVFGGDIADNVAFFHEGFQRAAARQRK